MHAVVVAVMAWAGGCESWRAANSCGAHPVLVCVVGCRRFALRCRCDCACSDTRRHLAEKSYWYVVVTCVKWRVWRSSGWWCREATNTHTHTHDATIHAHLQCTTLRHGNAHSYTTAATHTPTLSHACTRHTYCRIWQSHQERCDNR